MDQNQQPTRSGNMNFLINRRDNQSRSKLRGKEVPRPISGFMSEMGGQVVLSHLPELAASNSISEVPDQMD